MTYQMNSLHLDVLLKCNKKDIEIIDYTGHLLFRGTKVFIQKYTQDTYSQLTFFLQQLSTAHSLIEAIKMYNICNMYKNNIVYIMRQPFEFTTSSLDLLQCKVTSIY